MPKYSRKPHCQGHAFTLIELLIVIAIIPLLVSLVMPTLGSARALARSVLCASRQRNLALGWNYYHMDNNDVILPGRFGKSPLGADHDQYWVGNGWKYRPRWVAMMGSLTGMHPFAAPSPVKADGGDRQDYDSDMVYVCPDAAERLDERNYAYGYNYQFLGNARNHPSGVGYRNFPVIFTGLVIPASTVMAADSLGTAAAYATGQRNPYDNNGKDTQSLSNHGWSLDPPRLTAVSDRGPGDGPGDPRTAVDPRHLGKATVSFCDMHVETISPEELGYQVNGDGSFGENGHNRLFSGTGRDDDPPAVW